MQRPHLAPPGLPLCRPQVLASRLRRCGFAEMSPLSVGDREGGTGYFMAGGAAQVEFPKHTHCPSTSPGQAAGELDAWAGRFGLKPEYQSASAFGASFPAVKARLGLHASGWTVETLRPTLTSGLFTAPGHRPFLEAGPARTADARSRRPRREVAHLEKASAKPLSERRCFYPIPGRSGTFRHYRSFTCISLGRGGGRKEARGSSRPDLQKKEATGLFFLGSTGPRPKGSGAGDTLFPFF